MDFYLPSILIQANLVQAVLSLPSFFRRSHTMKREQDLSCRCLLSPCLSSMLGSVCFSATSRLVISRTGECSDVPEARRQKNRETSDSDFTKQAGPDRMAALDLMTNHLMLSSSFRF